MRGASHGQGALARQMAGDRKERVCMKGRERLQRKDLPKEKDGKRKVETCKADVITPVNGITPYKMIEGHNFRPDIAEEVKRRVAAEKPKGSGILSRLGLSRK